MPAIDYDQISKIYDDVRRADLDLLEAFLGRIQLGADSQVLDIGCGTANYTGLLQRLTGAQLCGVDPSAGMLEKARSKHPLVDFRQAEAASLPFPDAYFDFIYMTDVIHHIPNPAALFSELARTLKPCALACIVTQSHQQIAARPIAGYFPGTVLADQRRYPDIPAILQAAGNAGLESAGNDLLGVGAPVELGGAFLELVRKKGYSMLHLISDEEYTRGLALLERQLCSVDGISDPVPGPASPAIRSLPAKAAGETLVWLKRVAE